MASDVEIANSALQHLGVNTITSISQGTEVARNIALAYTPVLMATLRSHVWNFAITRDQLAADVDTPPFGYAYQYSLPNDYVRAAAPDTGTLFSDIDWKFEGGKILSDDAGPLNLRYVRHETDPNKMDPLFREVFAINLAIRVAEKIAPTVNVNKLFNLKNEFLEAARKANAFERIMPEDSPEDPWLTVRE